MLQFSISHQMTQIGYSRSRRSGSRKSGRAAQVETVLSCHIPTSSASRSRFDSNSFFKFLPQLSLVKFWELTFLDAPDRNSKCGGCNNRHLLLQHPFICISYLHIFSYFSTVPHLDDKRQSLSSCMQ